MNETEDTGILGLDVQLDESLLESVLVNNLISVEGEESLAAKVAEYVADAELWLRQELLGDYDPLLMGERSAALAVRCVVIKAVISAIPALDLVVTPTGFGVVSSSSLAPASKERVERLVGSLTSSLDGNLVSLFNNLGKDSFWLDQALPRTLCSTFFRLEDARFRTSDGDIFERFRNLREAGSTVIDALESHFLGLRLMCAMKREFHDDPYGDIRQLANPVRMASLRYFRALKSRPSSLPDEADMWHAAQSVIERLHAFPDLEDLWKSEMGHTVHNNPAELSRPGAYCF